MMFWYYSQFNFKNKKITKFHLKINHISMFHVKHWPRHPLTVTYSLFHVKHNLHSPNPLHPTTLRRCFTWNITPTPLCHTTHTRTPLPTPYPLWAKRTPVPYPLSAMFHVKQRKTAKFGGFCYIFGIKMVNSVNSSPSTLRLLMSIPLFFMVSIALFMAV